jgi:8-oxo-dGTP pyrophosphatase MutT (NUDIX family)
MRIRPTVRLLVLDECDRLLLFKMEDKAALNPARPDLLVYWATPGGGVEAGETFEEAGIRELWEETGIRVEALGPCVWERTLVLQFPDEAVQFDERYYVVRCSGSGVIDCSNHDAYERDVIRDYRWWSLKEMKNSRDEFLPPELPDLVPDLVP